MTDRSLFGESPLRILISSILIGLCFVACFGVYSGLNPSYEVECANRLELLVNGHDHQVSLESINSLDLLLPYLRDTLGPNFESSSSPESLEVYALNINVTQSTYYQIGDTSLYRIGAYQVVELPMGNFTNDCGSNPLFSNLSISCLPEYKVANSSARLIPGRYSEYSPLDGEVKLVYDFAEYSPSSDLRAISISLNVYSADTGSVGVVEVVMDRSVLGKVSVDSRVTVLPMDFLYLGGSGSSMEWMRAIVHILLVAFASLTCIGYPLTKALSGDSWTTYFSLDFVVPITVCVLVIISFAYHFSVIFSNRLVEVNLGISNFVDLHVEADTLVFLNSLNAFTLTLLTMYVFTRHLAHGGRKMFLPIFLFTVVMLAVALGLALGWSTVMSFQDFFFLLTRIGLGNVNMDDWAMLTSVGGLSMVALIVFFVMCMYWFIGLGIGLVLGSSKGWWTAPAMSPNPTTPPEDVNGDDEIATSLDMMSARAETELDLVHDDIREELSEAKRRLDAASRAIKTVVSRRRMQKLDLLSGSPAGSSSPLYPPLFTTGTTSPVKYPSLSSVDCEVCQRSIPESEIATHRASDEHLNNYRLYLGPSSWPANVHPAKDGGFRCTWCDKLLLGRDQLIGHLMGKEHNKRCQNSSIVPYGEDGHDAQVAEYVANYGNDPYARLKHWPVSIEDLGQFWICRLCGGERKKFQTQSAVNEHLNSSSHIALSSHGTAPMAPAATVSPKRPMDTSPARGAGWPECIALDDAYFWKCRLCNKQFNSPEHVEAHLSSDRHKSKMGRAALSPTGNFELFETSIQQKARAKMDRREMGRWIDRDRLECGLCVRKFSSLKEADHHFDELDHLCQWYTESIEKVISN